MMIEEKLDRYLTEIFYNDKIGECLNYGENGEELEECIYHFFKAHCIEYSINEATLFDSPGLTVGYVAISWIENEKPQLYCWNWRIV